MDKTCHVHALHRAGASIKEIMALTGLSRSAVEYRLTRLPPRQKRERKCLGCGETFLSAGPGNRLCRSCRQKAADVSPYAPDA